MHLHLTNFCETEKCKNKKMKFVNENYANVPKLSFFNTTDMHIVHLFSQYADN